LVFDRKIAEQNRRCRVSMRSFDGGFEQRGPGVSAQLPVQGTPERWQARHDCSAAPGGWHPILKVSPCGKTGRGAGRVERTDSALVPNQRETIAAYRV
jgi:hypothetical protein